MSQPLQKKPVKGLDALSGSERAELLRYSMLAAGVASFDWTLSDDRINWDGAIDLLPYHHDETRLARGSSFLGWLNPESRARLSALIETRSAQHSNFELALAASASSKFECCAERVSISAESRARDSGLSHPRNEEPRARRVSSW